MKKTAGSILAMALSFGCQHNGGGSGLLTPSNPAEKSPGSHGEVTFSWHTGVNQTNGKMRAQLPDGSVFNGDFLQVTAELEDGAIAPYYDAWAAPTWGVGDPWYGGSPSGFVTAYSGTAVAHLKRDDGARMRCVFELRDPRAGLDEGGTGQCQLSTGEQVFSANLSEGT